MGPPRVTTLVDTDILVDHLRGVREFEPADTELICSTITRAELFAGSEDQREAVQLLLSPFREIPVSRDVAELGGAISREASIPLPDALIAATAIQAKAKVATRNRKHFARVEGLQLSE